MKRTIRLNESELRNMIKETVKRVLMENTNIDVWLQYKPQIIRGSKGVIATSDKIMSSTNNQYEIGTASLIKNCAKDILEYVNDLDNIITQNTRKQMRETKCQVVGKRKRLTLAEEYDGYVSDSWWNWEEQYCLGKNGDDGANNIMDAVKELQNIIVGKNEQKILEMMYGKCGMIFSYIDCPEDKAWEEQ